ncbi:MAG: hypothetical protein AB7G88_04555 [Thermomicrobiales bacterium]
MADRRALLRGGVLFFIGLAVTGCVVGSDDDPSAGTSVEEGNSGGVAVTGPPVLGPVVWSQSVESGTNEPVSPVSSFPDSAPVIFAVFPVERLSSGIVIRASWTFDGEALDGVGAELAVTRDQIGGWLEFHLERTSEDPWPDGEYGIALTTESVLIATGTVSVVRAGT